MISGRVPILNIRHNANGTYIKERKDKISCKNNIQENKTCKKHKCKLNNEVLLKIQTNLKYGTHVYTGLFKLTKVNNNDTIKMILGWVTNTYNIRNLPIT